MASFKSKDNRNLSLCEESMLVFVNILKLSSLTLARTITTTTNSDHEYHPSIPRKKRNTRKAAEKSNKRSQKPEQTLVSKYVMLPDQDIKRGPGPTLDRSFKEEIGNNNVDGKFADYIRRFHEKTKEDHQNAIVEGKVENFIKRFHEKNMSDLNNESRRRSYVLPPPPHQVFK